MVHQYASSPEGRRFESCPRYVAGGDEQVAATRAEGLLLEAFRVLEALATASVIEALISMLSVDLS
jgi:hypothetical protein